MLGQGQRQLSVRVRREITPSVRARTETTTVSVRVRREITPSVRARTDTTKCEGEEGDNS